MRGGFTLAEGRVVRPASASSSTPGGKSAAVTFMPCTVDSDTRQTTNWPVARMLAAVSFNEPSGRGPAPKPTTTGSSEKALKKEYGAAFTEPASSWVTTQAIRRGTTLDTNSL